MPNWYYDLTELKTTPSIVGGMEYSTEQRYRKEGARFIFNVGTRMGLRNDTLATGVVYFHRFYMFHSFTTFPRFVTACCCLFLAGKVEETPKKCKDIIKTARIHLTARQFSQFGDDPKEEVMTLERILLQTIKFDLQVDHPYKYLLKYAKSLKGDKEKLQEMVQMAWTFINDSLCTTLCLQWEPEIIGIALMYLAGKLTKFEIVDWDGRTPKHKYWWDMFVENLNIDFLEGICHQFLDFYGFKSPAKPQDSPTNASPTKKPKKTHSSSRKNSVESAKSSGKSKSKPKTPIKDTPIANSESVPSDTSPPPPPPDRDAPNNSKTPVTTLPKQNSLITNEATNVTPTTSKPIIPPTVPISNVHSSIIQNIPNVDILHNQNYPQGMGQTHCIDQAQPIVYEGQQTSTIPVAQAVPHVLVPPPLFNSQHVNVYPQQCTVGEKLGNQPSNPYFASGTSPFNGQFPHLTYQQPPSQFYQRPEHQEHYYSNIHHASNQQNTYIPPAQCPVVSSLPVGQTLPPPQHPPPPRPLHLITLPPPSIRPPLQDQFASHSSQLQVQYHSSGHSPTMPFPLHQKQVSANSLSFATPGEGISPILPAEGVYGYGTDMQTQSAQHHHHNSVVIPSMQKF